MRIAKVDQLEGVQVDIHISSNKEIEPLRQFSLKHRCFFYYYDETILILMPVWVNEDHVLSELKGKFGI